MLDYRIITLVPEHFSIILHNAVGLECTLWPLNMCLSRIWHMALNDQQYSSNSHPCPDRSCGVFLAGVYTPTDALHMLKKLSFGATKVLHHYLGCLWLSVAGRGCWWLLVVVHVCGDGDHHGRGREGSTHIPHQESRFGQKPSSRVRIRVQLPDLLAAIRNSDSSG